MKNKTEGKKCIISKVLTIIKEHDTNSDLVLVGYPSGEKTWISKDEIILTDDIQVDYKNSSTIIPQYPKNT